MTLSNSLIEAKVAAEARIENIPLHKYMTEAEFATLMEVSLDAIRWFVSKSKLAHGVILADGTFLVHRLSAYRAVQNRFKNIIAREEKLFKKKMGISTKRQVNPLNSR